MRKQKHLIIGSGAAGLSALKEMRRLGSDDEIKIVTMENHCPYSPMSLPYLITQKIDEKNVWMAQNEFFESMQATFLSKKTVHKINTSMSEVIYDDGKNEQYDTLLIASGSEPLLQPVMRQANIQGFHIMDDYLRIKELKEESQVVIIGAGFVGMELAAALSEAGYHVSVVAPRERILRRYFDREVDEFFIRLFQRKNIPIHLSWGQLSNITKDGRISTLHFDSGKSIKAHMIIAAIGVTPRISLVKESNVKCNTGIVVDRSMKTNIDNLYAAGDVAESPHLITADYDLSLIWPSAVDQGKIAGSNIVGKTSLYKGWLSQNIFNFFGHVAISLGEVNSEHDECLREKDSQSMRYKKIVLRNNTIIGANFFNIDVDSGVIKYLIENKVDISKNKNLLLEKPREVSLWLMHETEKKQTLSLEH